MVQSPIREGERDIPIKLSRTLGGACALARWGRERARLCRRLSSPSRLRQ